MADSAYATSYIPERAMRSFEGDAHFLIEQAVRQCARNLEKLVGDDPIEVAIISPASPLVRDDERAFISQSWQVFVTNDPEYARWRCGDKRRDRVNGWAITAILAVNDVL